MTDHSDPSGDRVLHSETLSLSPELAARFSRAGAPRPHNPEYPSGLPISPSASAAPIPTAPEVPAFPFIDSLQREIPEELRSSKFYSVNLPSGFAFYPFKTLAVSLIKGSQQAKLTKAARMGSSRYTAEAIASTLSDPSLLHHLTLSDFNWLMYWLRQNSYTKSNMVHIHRCTDPKHNAQVKSGEKHSRSLLTEKNMDRTQLVEEYYNVATHDELFSRFNASLEGTPWVVDPPRVSDLIEVSEYMNDHQTQELDESGDTVLVDDEEQSFRCNLASAITRRDGVNTSLAERLAAADDLPVDVTTELHAFLIIMSGSYGVKEFVEIKCKDCGAVTRSQISITAHTFL